MAIYKLNLRKFFAGFMSVAIFFMYAVPLPVLASEITGFTQTSGTYNIEGQKFSGQTQFRTYDKFNLSKGDIANLMYRDGYKHFVNLVKNQVNINGIVNTMKGNNFYNGHAIFVSPNGIVIGASGVLNVGSLSLMTPSTAKFDSFRNAVENGSLSNYEHGASGYQGLISDSHGNIVVNGKIIARENINLYGDSITVQGSAADKAGMIAGVGNNNQVIESEDAAKELFNNLVSNNITDTTHFALDNGKVKIVAGYENEDEPELVKEAKVIIDNAQLGGDEVTVLANSKTQRIVDLPTDTSSWTQDHIDSLGFGVADEATSKIEITNSEISGKNVKIEANSLSKTKTNVNLLKPTIFDLVLNDEAKASEYFSSDVFTGFEGGRANAIVKVDKTTINAKNNVDISSNAEAELDINSKVLGQAIPALLYGLGTKTVSTVDIVNKSVINADSDVSISAVSSNSGSVSISNSSLVEMDATNALVMTLLNYSNITDTHAIIDSSEVNASTLDVIAVNMSETENELNQIATVGKNDFMSQDSYGSGAAFSILFNRSKNEVKALIKDSTITVEGEGEDGGVRVIAQSLNVTKNAIEASANDDNYRGTHPKTFDQGVKDKIKAFKNNYMKGTIKKLFKIGNMDVNMEQADDAKLQVGGVFLWNVSDNSATAKIENSTVNAKSLDVKSFTVDLLGNQAFTDAVGEAYYGAGVALIINDETNTTISNIDRNSKVTVDELTLDSITQLPMNAGSIKFGLSLPFEIFGVKDISAGVVMEGDPANNWNFDSIYPGHNAAGSKPAVSWEGVADQNITDTYGDLHPKFRLGGFLNNFAQGSGNGNSVAFSASVVVNNVINNTTASITGGSEVTVKNGNAILNAVTSVMGYNAVGIVDYLITKINYYIPGQQDWKYEPNFSGTHAGVGGSVLVDNYTNNATAQIKDSTVDVKKGNLNVRSASEASYLSALATGGTSETFVLDGSVHVQNLHGTTAAEILNSEIKNAKNIDVEAGNAKIKPTSSHIDQDQETSLLKTKDERDSKDKILNIILTGALAQQSEEVDGAHGRVPHGSTGVAIGADVNVSHSDRTVRAKVDGSTLTANENLTINGETKSQTINAAFAGAFAGGVSVNRERQQAANEGQQNDNQQMQNAGNWMDILNDAQADDDDPLGLVNLFNQNNPNQQGAANAQDNQANINHQNANVDNDGNINDGHGGVNPGDNNDNMADNQVGAGEARNNFSLAAAGVVDLYYDKTTTESVLTNSTINVGKKVDVKSDYNSLYVDLGGGVARAGNVGAGAAVNIYDKKTTTRSVVGDAQNGVTINYTEKSGKELNVTADDELVSVGIAIGVGMTKNEGEEDSGKKFAAGGSFNGNIIKDTTEATVQKTTVQNAENVTGDIATNVKADNDSIIVNATGGAAYEGGSEQSKGASAGIAVDLDVIEKTIKAQIIDSKMENAGAVTVEASMPIKAYSAGIAGAIVNGSASGYTFDGALVTELYGNTVASLIKDSTIVSSGDVNIHSKYDVKNMSLAGGIDFSNAQNGFGVGIGSVIYVEKNTISANTDNVKITKSKSVKLSSEAKEDMKFLAANLGMQTKEGSEFKVNGAAGVLLSAIEAKAINKSELKSNGSVSILSDYDSSYQGITVVGDKTKDSLALGANLLGSYYGVTTHSELGAGSMIESKKDEGDSKNYEVRISATSKEYINYIPVSIVVASGNGNSVGADIAVDVIKNTTQAFAYGNVTSTGDFIVKALDDTMIYERGGVLSYAGGSAGIGSVVYYDYLNKTITAEVKNNTVSAANVTVQATAENSFGGTKKDGEWDVSEMSTNAEDYDKNFEQGSFFFNWNMGYSLAHGDKISAAGSVIVRVLDDVVKANVEKVDLGTNDKKASSLTIYANDYTIMNIIAGQFSASGKAAVGGNSIIAIGNTKTQAFLTGGKQYLSGDLSVNANTKKLAHTVLVGGSGSSKVAVNGAVYVNKNKDEVTSSIIGSDITANNVKVNSTQKNDSLGVDLSVGGSGTASVGGILYLNLFEDTTKALVGDNSNSRTKITSANDIEVKSDSDYEAREYLISVEASGKVGVSGMGIANVMDSTIESGVYNSDITSSNGKLDVNSFRGFNKDYSNKTAFFRTWFKDTDAYKNEGVNKDTKERSEIGENDLGKLAPIVGAINVSAGGKGAVTGTIIVNKARGSLTSKIDKSVVSTKTGTTVLSQQNFTNFDAVAAVAGAATGSANGVGVINSFVETVTAWVDNSTINNGSVTTDAQSNMNLNQLVISGQGAGKGADIGVVVDYSNIEDDVNSYITNTTAEAGANAYSAHNIMINNILLAGGGVGQGLTANVVAIVNNFGGEKTVNDEKVKTGQSISKIENSTVNNGDITLSSFDNLDNLSAIVGISFAGQGANLAGYAVRNALSNKPNAYINNTTINTTGGINIAANSLISSTNAIFSAGIVGQGATVLANVISNTITSDAEGYIKDSTITKSGNIEIIANVKKDNNGLLTNRVDEMTNTTGNFSFAGQGASLSTNVIYTNYSNTVKTYIENTSSTNTGDITLKANSKRNLDNTNIGVGGAAMGASVGVNAISTNIETETLSYIDAKLKNMNGVGNISIYSRDNTVLNNVIGTVQAAGLGVAAGVGLDVTWNNGIAKSEIKSDVTAVRDLPDVITGSDETEGTDSNQTTQETNIGGEINAKSANIQSENILEYDKTNVGVSMGLVGLAGDYVLLKSGKRTDTYSQSEQDSNIDKALIKLGDYKPKFTPTPSDSDIKTGSVSRINGNLKTSGNIALNAESKLKGKGNNDKLSLSNVTVTVGLGTGSVGIKDVDLASNTNASIIGGNVESGGDISVNAKSTSNVEIKSVKVDVSGVTFSGGSSIYTNSSETVADIGKSTDSNDTSSNKKTTVIAGGNIDVVSNSTSNSDIDATYVLVSGGNVVAVDLVENKDTNKSSALVTGQTNIDSKGKLNLHSTTTTDLKSNKQTVSVRGVSIVNVSKNDVNVSTINRALIENVTGKINSNGLDIITDYGAMNTLGKTNVVAVDLGGVVSVDKSGAYMNATFKSGIDSKSGLVLKNIGTTNIITAKDNGSNGMVAKGEIYNVSVSIQKFASVSQAKAENTAKSETVLKSNDFTTDSLNIYSYLNSSAKADSTGTNVALGISVDAVKAKTKDTSTMNFDVDGNNTVIGTANIVGTHNATTNADLSAFNFSLLAGGASTDISSELTANTTGNISGNFNAGIGKIELNTTRESRVSKSSGGGGIIAVNNPDVTNNLTGTSVLNIVDFKTQTKKGQNSWTISNKSNNVFNMISSDGSGGLISVSSSGLHTTFDTTTQINVSSSSLDEKVATNINSEENVGFKVENTAVVNESASNSGGGFVAVTTNNVSNEYKSHANLSIKDSKINAKEVKLETTSDIHTKDSGYVEYTGGAGGFVAVNDFNITNKLTQTSVIDIINSELRASKNFVVKALTKSGFKQRIEANGYGFISVPRGYNTLEVNNTNTLNVDSSSKLVAGDEMDINFDSSDTLWVKTVSDARNFEGKPSAYAWLRLDINNNLNNSGSIEAGNLVDINFMNASTFDLYQHAYSECHAAVASTNEGGILHKAINSKINVASGADITSGHDVEIDYSSGSGNNSSYVGWKTVSYAFLGIPITHSNDYTVYDVNKNSKLILDGEIVAGQASSKYMKINREGKVDKSVTFGFYDDEYTVSNDETIPGSVIKQKTLNSITIELDNIEESLEETNKVINEAAPVIADLNSKKDNVQVKLDDINGLVADGYEMKNSVADDDGNGEFNNLIKNDIKALVIKQSDEDTDRITQAQYDQISSDYSDRLEEVNAYNYGHFDKKEIPTMSKFIDNADSYELTDAQRQTISNLTEEQIATFKSNYGVDNTKIIGTGADQITQEQFNVISGAFDSTLAEIKVYNYGHDVKIAEPTMLQFLQTKDYGLSETQITTVSTGYTTVYSNVKPSDTGAFTTYKNTSGKYVAVANPKTETVDGGTVKTCDEIKIFNGEITRYNEQIIPYQEKLDASIENVKLLEKKQENLTAYYNEVEATPESEYEQKSGVYQIVFNDINPQASHIIVDGAVNSNIEGSGNFRVATPGIRIDNYSTRTLIFNDINLSNASNAGLFIQGKNHSEFLNKQQAVSGSAAYIYMLNGGSFDSLPTAGVHYTNKNSAGTYTGITINNYYDIYHPFASTFKIPHPTQQPDIFIIGDVSTSGDLNLWNESGDIGVLGKKIDSAKKNVVSSNGLVALLNYGEGAPFKIGPNDYIFGGSSVSLATYLIFDVSGEINIEGTVQAGYSNRSIVITDDMIKPENLIFDNTSEEKNLINLGGNTLTPYLNDGINLGNIKAIYQDGQIYLYNLSEYSGNLISISAETESLSGTVILADGYKNINIDNKTNATLNVKNIENNPVSGRLDSDVIQKEGSQVIINKVDYANTNITSQGKLVLDGVIKNNTKTIIDYPDKSSGILNITAKNGLEITQQKAKVDGVQQVIDSIVADGTTKIMLDGGQGNINGNITANYKLEIDSNSSEALNINGNLINDRVISHFVGTNTNTEVISTDGIYIKNNNNGALNILGNIEEKYGKIDILSNAQTNIIGDSSIYNKNGNISIESKGLTTSDDSKITADNGNIIITNNSYYSESTEKANLTLNGIIKNKNGNVKIVNNGNSANLGYTVVQDGVAQIVGSISDQNGDIEIINNKGDMTITSVISHNEADKSASGMISIINSENAEKLDIKTTIQTFGTGKAVSDGTTETLMAILIDNQSVTDGLKLDNSTVSARLGNIVIKNANKDMDLIGGTITNNQNGGISIINDGEKLESTASINVNSGNVNVLNTGSGQALVGGSIINQNGNTTVENKGAITEVTGTIDNVGGNVTVKNANAQTRIVGNITNKGGNTVITNNGNYTEIASSVKNEGGNVDIYNKDGNLRITSNAIINNTTDNPNNYISVINDGKNLSIEGNMNSINKGDVILTNRGEIFDISGNVHVTDGVLNISNTNTNTENAGLNISGYLVDDKGNILISNNSYEKINVSGTILGKEGDMSITSQGGITLASSGYITDNKGDVSISNSGGSADFKGTIRVKDGETNIVNSGKDISISGNVVDDKGDLKISNYGVDGAVISGIVRAKEGNAIINNTKGGMSVSGIVQDDLGNITISDTSEKDLSVSGKIIAKSGNIGISKNNAGDFVLSQSGIINNQTVKMSDSSEIGNISISNSGQGDVSVSGKVIGNDGNIAIENTIAGGLNITSTGYVQDNKGNVSISNSGSEGISVEGTITDKSGNMNIENTSGGINVVGTGKIVDDKGDIKISNTGSDGITVSGSVVDKDGDMNIENTSGGINVALSGYILDNNGDMTVSNTGLDGISVKGYIRGKDADVNITNRDSNILIGEYNSYNDNYIDVTGGNINIIQTNGNILNGIVDSQSSNHSNHDLGNVNHAYKTLISTTDNLTIEVKDGDIGTTNNDKPGFSIDAQTRDFTESININVAGNVVAKATNNDKTDARLINIRAKDSDLNVKDITSDGNVILTAADWKQADVRPTPKEEEYFIGYSVYNKASADTAAVTGQNISVISSDKIGTEDKKFVYKQDTAINPQSSVSFEAENDINITGRSNSSEKTKIYQLISKRGNIGLDLESDAVIREITAGKGLSITQKAQNLTIMDLGMPGSSVKGNTQPFNDMLNPHDDLVFGENPEDPSKSVVPNYVVIKVLDAMENSGRADSNLKIYSAYVKGNHGENTQYYPDGARLADVTLMADNIYANSSKAPDSNVSTKKNPNGYKQTDKTYTDEDFGGDSTKVYKAKGINAYGEGEPISLDILGVDKDIVNEVVSNPRRTKYITQKSKTNIPDEFKNKDDRTKFYGYDFKADNVVISVNDYVDTDRGVSVDTIYANDAYVNTHDTNLTVEDGYINNYAEFRNGSKLAVVDNDFRRIVPSDMQLYTQKTGSFSMKLSDSTVMHTSAPVVDFDPYHLVNMYSSENSFVNLTFKETSIRQHNKDVYKELERKNDYYNKSVSLVFNTLGYGLLPDDEIYEVSRTGAIINAKDLKVGQGVNIKLKFNDIDVDVEAKVKEIHVDKATVEFLDIPEEISNSIMYEYMKKIKAMKNSISSL